MTMETRVDVHMVNALFLGLFDGMMLTITHQLL